MARIHDTKAANIQVGDEVGIFGSYDHQTKIVKVVHVTPTGHIETEDGKRFNPKGECRANDNLRLHTAESVREHLAAKQAVRERGARAHKFIDHVKNLVRGKTNGFGEVCGEWTAEEKAELIRLVEAL